MVFELFSLPSISNIKPTELMRHMLTLMPDDDRTSKWLMAMFFLRLPPDMRDLIVAKDFTDCQEMAEYIRRPDLLQFQSTPCASVTGVGVVTRIDGDARPCPTESSTASPPAARARATGRPLAPTVMAVPSACFTPPRAIGPKNVQAWLRLPAKKLVG